MTKTEKYKADRAKEINSFSGEFKFLSNFYLFPISYNGVIYPCTENAYQAQKTTNEEERMEFCSISPAKAKQRGRQVDLRPKWDSIREEVMYCLLKAKFHDAELQRKLLDTHPRPLVEGNWWGDEYWGRCEGKGKNRLGVLLMKVREHYLFGNKNARNS